MEDFSQMLDVDDLVSARRTTDINGKEDPTVLKEENDDGSINSDSTPEHRLSSVHGIDSVEEEDEEIVMRGDEVPLNDEEQALNALLKSNATKEVIIAVTNSEGRAKPLERLRLLPDAMEHEEESYSKDYHGEPSMDNSKVRMKQQKSFFQKMSSMVFKKYRERDESKEKLLPQDTFSYMIIAKTCSSPFNASLIIFALQISIFMLTLVDLSRRGSPGNFFGVPANVSAELRATQFIAVLVAVLTQGDLRTASMLLRDGFNKDFDAAFMDTAPWKFNLSIAARAVSGSIGLVVSFVLIITAGTVLDLLLNFTAMEFVAGIDELCFFLSRQGFLGHRCKTTGNIIANTLYQVRPESRMGCFRRAWKTISLVSTLAMFLSGWSIIVIFQLSGKYVCNTLMVQMGDDFVPALGTFNGLYDLESPGGYIPFSDRRVRYIERRSEETLSLGRGVLDYCQDLQAWTFRWESKDGSQNSDPCDWVARSSETMTYDITETLSAPWLVRATSREVVLEPFRLYCFDCSNEGEENSDDCAGQGTCSHGVCACAEGWYGLRCGFPTPCNALAIDARTEEFASTRDWSSNYKTIQLESGSLVESYNRPVYVNEYANGDFDVVMFTGRRWALTSSDFLPRHGRISDADLRLLSENHEGTGNEIGNFFRYLFHGYMGFEPYSVAFLSDYMDFNTDRDASSPVEFAWYRTASPERTSEKENQGPAKEVDSQFLCELCDDDSNPCLYDGVCFDGACKCSLDSFGSLCEIPPVRNGHCDPFFNTPEFKMDGGDCCESTCVSTSKYICGAEEAGYVNTGYYSCKLPPDKWQDYPLNGDAGAFSGFSLDLSQRSLGVGELFQDRVRIYDKVGSSWVLRANIDGTAGDSFGTAIAVSAGPYNVVSNPSFVAPLTVAVYDKYRTLRIYKCDSEVCQSRQNFTWVYGFDLSGDGSVLALSVFNLDQTPPTQVKVFENVLGTFAHRADVNVTKDDTLFSIYAMSLSGDGNKIVLQKQLADAAGKATYDGFEVRLWNGVSYELEWEFPFVLDFNAYAYSLPLSISEDGSVLAFGVPECSNADLQVFRRSETGGWVKLASPLLDTTGCVDSARPKRNNCLALSRDGSTVAFRLGERVKVFTMEAESDDWRLVGGDDFSLKSYPLAISSDGKELAVGSPEEGYGGITTIYSLPSRTECPPGQSLLRISLTVDKQSDFLRWHLKNNDTGEVLYQEGRYSVEYSFGTMVEEKCIAKDACYVFTVYDEQFKGLQAPGQFALFMDGKDVGRGTFDKLYQRVYFGNNCKICPEGTKRFNMMVLTCGPISWNLLHVTSKQPLEYEKIASGNNTEPPNYTDEVVYPACTFAPPSSRICDDPLEMYHDACLDPDQCYAVNIMAYYKSVSFVEIDFDGVKTAESEVLMCAGKSAFAGNLDRCPD